MTNNTISSSDDGNVLIRRNDDSSQYELLIDGRLTSRAEYHDHDGTVTFSHTFTTPPMRGNGFAERLVQFALDDVAARGRTVVAQCWFVAGFIRDHPRYQRLLRSPVSERSAGDRLR